ncbi:uncharacterized protein LOC106879749 [Octopus bimaculoides]|uniref:uncharacterized protein LOC106879749 n=1 Tax=Octopus bimaculoides TaxID=37653 RepID=UPI00071D5621|nr:uncharacterized protein LOC106879749 [Octopus bimaculoides]|eukprot:XP_014784914.1 PREDICTED: uncharacterized protein LOC106879749 [Octopus bimaculoides]
MVFAARQLQEKCQERNVDLYSTYVDLTKAFDTDSREGLWRILAKYGCLRKCITIVRRLHNGMLAMVQDNGETSDPFPVYNGVKQGFLAPTTFSLTFSAMLTDAFRDTDIRIGIKYRSDGSVFNHGRLKAKTKRLNAVDRFTYLGSTLYRNIVVDEEINARLGKANAGKDQGIQVCCSHNAAKWLRVLDGLLALCQEAEPLSYNTPQKTSRHKVAGQDPDTEVLIRANLPSIHTLLMQSQIRWAGHVAHVSDDRLPKRLIFGELQKGKRSQGGQKKRFKDILKASLKAFNIDHDTWEQSALDRERWRSAVHKGANTRETNRIAGAEYRRQARKNRANNPVAGAIIP